MILNCPECGKKLRVRDELAGKRGKCPGCGELFVIPAPESHAEPSPIPAWRHEVPRTDQPAQAPPTRAKRRSAKWPLVAVGSGLVVVLLCVLAYLVVSAVNRAGTELSDKDLKALLSKGGDAWESLSARGDMPGGDVFWIWPAEDRVLTAPEEERWIKFRIHWRLRPGKTLPEDGLVFTCADMSRPGVLVIVPETLAPGANQGTLDCSFDRYQYGGEGVVAFYLHTKGLVEELASGFLPRSNVLLLAVKFSD